MTGAPFAALLLTAVSAACGAYIRDYSPGFHPGPCRDPASGQMHQAGDVFYPRGRCEEWHCTLRSNKPVIAVTGCPHYARPVGCTSALRRVGDPSLLYPGCCVRYDCDRTPTGQPGGATTVP